MNDFQKNVLAIAEEINSSFSQWMRHVLSLETGALALLVAMKNNYVSDASCYVWLLKLCWLSLGTSIFLGVVILYAGVQLLTLKLKTYIHNQRQTQEPEEQKQKEMNPIIEHGKKITFCHKLFLISGAVSLISLVSFAVLNLK